MANIKVITTEEDFLALKPRWNELIAYNQQARVFQTFEWCYAAWKHYITEGQLYILHAKREGHKDEEAIFPFWIDPQKNLRFIGDDISDVCNVICTDFTADWHHLYNDVTRFLKEEKRFKKIQLSHVEAHARFMAYLGVYYPDIRITRMDSYSCMDVKQNNDLSNTLTHLNSKERSYIRSLERKLTQFEMILLSSKNAPFPRNTLTSLCEEMIQLGLRPRTFFSEKLMTTIESIYNAGLCEIIVFKKENECCAASFRLIYKKHLNYWIQLYQDASYTTLQDVAYVTIKSKEENYCFDYGTGAYAYKLGTFRPSVHHLYLIESVPLTLKNFVREGKKLVRIYLKAFAARMNLLPILSRLRLVKNVYR